MQLYISQPVASVTRSVEDLRGFQNIYLQAGETKQVTFPISTGDLKFYNSKLEYDWEPGDGDGGDGRCADGGVRGVDRAASQPV